MRDDADQLARGVTRQARIAVERDAILNRRLDRQVADLHDEAGIGSASEQAVELFDLPPLALPSHPQALLLVPLTSAMEKEEAIGPALGVPGVQGFDTFASGCQNLAVARERFARGVPEIAQDGELDVPIDVAERLHLDVGEQIVHSFDAVEHRGHDDDCPCGLRDVVQFQAGEPARWDQVADDPLQDLNRQLGRWHDREQPNPHEHRAAPTVELRIRDRP